MIYTDKQIKAIKNLAIKYDQQSLIPVEITLGLADQLYNIVFFKYQDLKRDIKNKKDLLKELAEQNRVNKRLRTVLACRFNKDNSKKIKDLLEAIDAEIKRNAKKINNECNCPYNGIKQLQKRLGEVDVQLNTLKKSINDSKTTFDVK